MVEEQNAIHDTKTVCSLPLVRKTNKTEFKKMAFENKFIVTFSKVLLNICGQPSSGSGKHAILKEHPGLKMVEGSQANQGEI